MTGTLYKVNPSDMFKQGTQSLSYRIISTTMSYITPPSIMSNGAYIVRDPVATLTFGFFNVIDTDGLQGVFEILTEMGGPVDPTLMTLGSNTNNPP